MILHDGRYGAIDIGTVTTRMLVADVVDGVIVDVDRQHRITNLGVGVDSTGRLAPEAMERVLAALRDFLRVRDRLGAERGLAEMPMGAVATSAARDASNGEEFADAVRALGVPLTIIDGWQEGTLTYQGVAADFPGETLGVLDIGGGSTELILGAPPAEEEGDKPPEPALLHSFNIGSRRLTARWLPDDPPTPEQYDQLREAIVAEMAPRLAEMKAEAAPVDRLVAVAGTATSVVSVRDGMEVYDPALVHRSVVTADELRAVIERLAPLPIAERAQVPGLEPARAPMIVAGMYILAAVLDLWRLPTFTVSESDLLHGLISATAR